MHHLKTTSKIMQKPQALMLSRQIIVVPLNMRLLWIYYFYSYVTQNVYKIDRKTATV